jgi:Zn-dependent protease with chaperone function
MSGPAEVDQTVPTPLPPLLVPAVGRVPLRRRVFADRPLGYPNPLVWLRSGILRDWRGPVGALISTWFYLPIGITFGVVSAILLGLGGLLVGGLGLHGVVPAQLHNAPLVGTAIDGFLSRSGGILVGLLGLVLGAVGGFLAGVLLPWYGSRDEPLALGGGLLGILFSAVLLGIGYTLYRVMLERWLLHVTGARRPSWRESQLLTPMLHQCARDLGLPNVPRLLIDDRLDANAHAYTRHIVVNKGLLEEFDYHPGAISAVLAHELVHWRNGDPVTAAFIRGIALPLYLIYAVPTWVTRKYPHPIIKFLMFLNFWPVLLTVRYVVMPLQAMDTRRAELRADQGAVLVGHRAGMRRVLSRHRSFESGRNGWDEAVCATHPPTELRLEQLEAPGRVYPLPEQPAEEAPEDPGVLAASRSIVFADPGGNRAGWIVVAGTVVTACLVLATLAVVQWRYFQPGNAVSAYFDALYRHDGVGAGQLAVADTGGFLRNPAAPVPPDVIRSADYQPPSDFQIGAVTTKGDDAVVDVTYRLGGAPQSDRIALRKDSHPTHGVFHGWHIVGVGTLAVAAPGTSALRVDGVDVATSDGALMAAAPPGVYQIALPDNPLAEAQPVTVTVGLTDSARTTPATLTPTIKAAARTEIDKLVRADLDGCAKQKVAAPAGCPFRLTDTDVSGDVLWTITAYPTLNVELTGLTEARVTTRQVGQLVVSSRTGYGPFTSSGTFAVSGTVGVAGDHLTWQRQS